MQQIRANVFETNSSSSHSLVISEEGLLDLCPFSRHVMESGIIHIESSEYGWEVEYYNDVYSKLSYLFTDAMRGERNSVDFKEYSNEKLDLIKQAVKEHTGLECEFRTEDDVYYPYGYIDHQSVGLCEDVWDKGVEGVIQFVFNPGSYFETDNDNH